MLNFFYFRNFQRFWRFKKILKVLQFSIKEDIDFVKRVEEIIKNI